MRISVFALLLAISCIANAQVQTHIITLGGDSILYSNSKFRFTEFIDARNDTTKLGLLKENYNSSQHQLINFPNQPTDYLPSFLNAVVNYASNTENICVVIKELSITEEPLGAIEVAKSRTSIDFYLVKNGNYKLVKKGSISNELPMAEVTGILGLQMETSIRNVFHDFLANPSSEGENSQWLTRSELLEISVPKNRVSMSSIGKLEYAGLKFNLNGKNISRKKAVAILQMANDDEINKLLENNKKNIWLSTGFSAIASGLVLYPIADYANNKAEFKGNYVMYGTASAIIALVTAKVYRDNMREAVKLFNERYNE